MSFSAGDMNIYRYCRNDPLGLEDGAGLAGRRYNGNPNTSDNTVANDQALVNDVAAVGEDALDIVASDVLAAEADIAGAANTVAADVTGTLGDIGDLLDAPGAEEQSDALLEQSGTLIGDEAAEYLSLLAGANELLTDISENFSDEAEQDFNESNTLLNNKANFVDSSFQQQAVTPTPPPPPPPPSHNCPLS